MYFQDYEAHQVIRRVYARSRVNVALTRAHRRLDSIQVHGSQYPGCSCNTNTFDGLWGGEAKQNNRIIELYSNVIPSEILFGRLYLAQVGDLFMWNSLTAALFPSSTA